jgi:mono/diheme cytochrome c family protein
VANDGQRRDGNGGLMAGLGLGVVSGVALVLVATFSCTKKTSAPAAADENDLVRRGRAVYNGNCTACHATDPHKAGTLGPDLFGSSLELLEARVLRGDYPPGYEPKRKSQAMPKLPHLKDDLPALHAFLNAGPK